MTPLEDCAGLTIRAGRWMRRLGALALALVAHGCISGEDPPGLVSATGNGTR